MSENERDLFAGVEALLAQAAGSDLPPPAERARLRQAAGLTQAQIAKELGLKRRETVAEWENGEREPRPPRRTAYLQLLQALAARFPAPEEPDSTAALAVESVEPSAGAPGVAGPDATVPPAEAPVRSQEPAAPVAPPPAPAETQPARSRPRPAARNSNSRPAKVAASPASSSGGQFADGPMLVLDGDGTGYGTGGQIWDVPAATVSELVAWVLDRQFGSARLHQYDSDADPLAVLTPGAVARLGLPPAVEDIPAADGAARRRRLPDEHPVITELADAGWQLTRAGFGPWARIYQPPTDGKRRCVQLCVLPWDALETRAWGDLPDAHPAQIARTLGLYATRVLTPTGFTATAGLDLMTALRPPTRPVWSETDQRYVSGPLEGSLTAAVDPAPPEAPLAHPLAQGRPETPSPLHEEPYDWARDPETLSDAECAMPYALGLDIHTAFLAAANRLTVGYGAPVHIAAPAFDKKQPGSWLVDLSHIETDPRLPSPFTPDGTRPTGPAWYATPTVAYAVELGATVHPTEAWLRTVAPEGCSKAAGGYLDLWYGRLSTAYLETMGRLGVTPDLDPPAYLDAMERLAALKADPDPDADPALRAEIAVLNAVKATAKGGIGKLMEKPRGRGWRPGQRWYALDRPTWRPDIRAAVISTARMWMHRRMRAMARHDLYPLGVLSDCVVYPSPGSSPLDLVPLDGTTGKPAKGVFPLGVAPGQTKLEGARPLLWAVELLDTGGNPARHIKGDGHDAVAEGE